MRDDQFPAQGTTGIRLDLSPFSVRLKGSIGVQIGPLLGPQERGPAFFDSQDPSGRASGFLQQIAGGFDGVGLSSDCLGVLVTGLDVTPRQQASQCLVEAEVDELDRATDSVVITDFGS